MNTKIVLALFAFFVGSFGLSCSAQWECSSVTTDFNYVLCSSGKCRCRTELGFSGNATTTNKCRCASPGQVYWGNGTPYCKICTSPAQIMYMNNMPYCVDGAECEQFAAVNARNERRKQVVRDIYTGLLGNGPTEVVTGQRDLSHIFSHQISGRVTPVGDFHDFEGVVEYFYGLIAAGGTKVPQVVFPYLSQAEGDRVAVRVDIMLNGTQRPPYNLTETGWFKFNDQDLVEAFDVSILNIGAAIDPPPAGQAATINRVCATLLTSPGNCHPGTYEGSYSSLSDCISFMQSIPFGSWNRANSNTVTCRLLHSILTVFRPQLHCPHSGKTGGGKCIDFSINSYYDKYF